MASFNRVMLIGRLTRNPEVRQFANGGKVAKFGFAVAGQRKKNQETGQWEEEPCFLDVEVFNRGDYGKSADLAEQYLAKGRQIFIEGHLRQDSWQAKDGTKKNKLVVVADSMRFLDPKAQETRDKPEPVLQELSGEEILLKTIETEQTRQEIPF
jgi:single-strand DNA-binding protein